MSEYRFPRQDAQFVLDHIVNFSGLCAEIGHDDLASGLSDAILDEAARLGEQVLAPLNKVGDQQGAVLGEKGVEETAGFAQAYKQFAQSGWPSLVAPEAFGGQALPKVISTAVNEVWQSSNMAFALCPLLTQGAIEALLTHASDELKETYVTPLVSGEWTATMNLTEPDAGSDLAAIKSRAVPEGDHYRITGQKIFITWGDHQMADNIIHLVLARLPDAPAGVKGISLFVVPKFLVNADGSLGERNDAKAVSLEHKLGIHASPTCVMSFGDEGGAIGYLVGEPHTGLACMFTMMNDARQGVGLQGLAISERAYQHARTYAKERIQGTLRDGSRVNLMKHPDVRRMLMLMKSGVEAMRALMYLASATGDQLEHASENEAHALQARVDLYTPIVKGWMTELAQEVTSLGVQIHGGMGFVEETGAAQFLRDARILPIYEGTTGIQALDLVGRKTLSDEGQALTLLLQEVETELANMVLPVTLSGALERCQMGVDNAKEALAYLLANPKQAPAIGVNLMMLLGYLLGGWLMLRAAGKAQELSKQPSADTAFLMTKQQTAHFYCEHYLPRIAMHLAIINAGGESLMAIDEAQF